MSYPFGEAWMESKRPRGVSERLWARIQRAKTARQAAVREVLARKITRCLGPVSWLGPGPDGTWGTGGEGRG